MSTVHHQTRSSFPDYTPDRFWALLRGITEKTKPCGPVHVEGVYEPGNAQQYGGFYYDRLALQGTNKKITLQVPEEQRLRLRPGSTNRLLVRLYAKAASRSQNTFTVEVCAELLDALDALGPQETGYPAIDRNREAELHRRKAARDVDANTQLYRAAGSQQETPIDVMVGVGASVFNDIVAALGEGDKTFRLRQHSVNFQDVHALESTLRTLDVGDAAAIVIARGGGAGLNMADEYRLAASLLDLSKPTIAAIGHAGDFSVVAQVADTCRPTPTAIGYYLKELAAASADEHAHEHKTSKTIEKLRKKVSEHRNRYERLSEQLSEKQRAIDSLTESYEQLTRHVGSLPRRAIMSFVLLGVGFFLGIHAERIPEWMEMLPHTIQQVGVWAKG